MAPALYSHCFLQDPPKHLMGRKALSPGRASSVGGGTLQSVHSNRRDTLECSAPSPPFSGLSLIAHTE